MRCHFPLLAPLVIAGLFVVLPWTIALPLAAFVAVPTALIVYAGWLWLGEASPPLAKGQPVEVVEVVGATVRVRPWT